MLRYASLRHRTLLLLFTLGAASLGAATFPGKSWQLAERPEDHGFSSEKLAQARAFSKTIDTAAFMIVHDGIVVAQWGDVRRRFNSHSIRKSFLAFLYGRPVRDGRIRLNATMAELGIDDVHGLSAEEKQATVHDLLKARSGIYHPALYETERMKQRKPKRHSAPPGTRWYYNNWDFNAAGTIYQRLTGRDIFKAIHDEIAAPIGMEDFRPGDGTYVSGRDSMHRAYPFRISARDLARFGLLALRRGEWNGRQVIDASWVDECTAFHSDAASQSTSGYGYMWWVSQAGTKHPHLAQARVPPGSYSARGAGGHHLLVIPAAKLVIVHRVDTDHRGKGVTTADFGRLVQLVLNARLATDETTAE
jgi:CubicO group peptidase (beta-lactamase class C family)